MSSAAPPEVAEALPGERLERLFAELADDLAAQGRGPSAPGFESLDAGLGDGLVIFGGGLAHGSDLLAGGGIDRVERLASDGEETSR